MNNILPIFGSSLRGKQAETTESCETNHQLPTNNRQPTTATPSTFLTALLLLLLLLLLATQVVAGKVSSHVGFRSYNCVQQ